jgi:hypothetical protein
MLRERDEASATRGPGRRQHSLAIAPRRVVTIVTTANDHPPIEWNGMGRHYETCELIRACRTKLAFSLSYPGHVDNPFGNDHKVQFEPGSYSLVCCQGLEVQGSTRPNCTSSRFNLDFSPRFPIISIWLLSRSVCMYYYDAANAKIPDKKGRNILSVARIR